MTLIKLSLWRTQKRPPHNLCNVIIIVVNICCTLTVCQAFFRYWFIYSSKLIRGRYYYNDKAKEQRLINLPKFILFTELGFKPSLAVESVFLMTMLSILLKINLENLFQLQRLFLFLWNCPPISHNNTLISYLGYLFCPNLYFEKTSNIPERWKNSTESNKRLGTACHVFVSFNLKHYFFLSLMTCHFLRVKDSFLVHCSTIWFVCFRMMRFKWSIFGKNTA